MKCWPVLERRSLICLIAAALFASGCTSAPGSQSDSTADPTTPAASTNAITATATQLTLADQVPYDDAGSLNVGCIKTRGVLAGEPSDWYREDAAGVVTLDIGDAQLDAEAAVPLADLARAAGGGQGQTNTWEYTAKDDPSCVIGRGAAAINPDGSQVRISVWRLTGAVRPSSLEHHAPFVVHSPDLFVSDARASGDIVVLKVLPDGTTIKIVALGIDALGFAGWPTTLALPVNAAPPEPPAEQVTDLVALAAKVAATI